MKRYGKGTVLIIICAALALCFPRSGADAPILPAGVKTVGEEAFRGDRALEEVTLPDGLKAIESRAFADSGVKWIRIPDSVTSIAEDAFRGAGGAYPGTEGKYLVISASAGSVAADFAARQGAEANVLRYTGAVTLSYRWKQKLAAGLEFDLDPVPVPAGQELAFDSETGSATVDADGHVKITGEGTVAISFTDREGKHSLVSQDVLPVFYFRAADDPAPEGESFIFTDTDAAGLWRCALLKAGEGASPAAEEADPGPEDKGDKLYVNAVGLGPWQADVTEGGDWLRLNRQSGSESEIDLAALYTADKNTSGKARTGRIRFRLDRYEYVYDVLQPPEGQTVRVQSVKLDRSAEVLMPGDVLRLTATVTPENATDPSVTWTATGSAATVKHGLVTAVKPGSSQIIVQTTDGGKAASCAVTVVNGISEDLPDDDTLCLVAMGYQLNPDGTMREELIGRLMVLKRVSEKYPNALIVCTGGATASGNPSATEADRMANWLRRHGVDSGRILVETRSMTTGQNAVNTVLLLTTKYPRVTNIVIVTSDYHMAGSVQGFRSQVLRAGGAITVTAGPAWPTPKGQNTSPAQDAP